MSRQTSSTKSLSPSSSGSSYARRQDDHSKSRAIWRVRILFIFCLCAVACVLGFTANYFLTKAEKDLAYSQFESSADRALTEAYVITKQKRWSAVTMASVASQMLPDAEDFPFVTIPGFERITKNLLETSGNEDMGFVPLVRPDQLSEWQDFIYKYYETSDDPVFPNGTAISSFGKGVWATNPNLDSPDKRFHDTGEKTRYGSPYKVITPVTQVNEGPDPILLFNLHSEPPQGKAIDEMIACAERRAMRDGNFTDQDCGVITDMVKFKKRPSRGPAAVMFTPIYPKNNKTTMVGFIPTVIIWDQLLQNAFADEVSGIDCVLETERGTFTYTVVDGIALPKGEGDLHQTKYDSFRRSIKVACDCLFEDTSPTYTLSLYPNDKLYEVYSTKNPTTATIGAIIIILFTSLLFFLYDFLVCQEFLAKRDLLAAKRNFMRFVSHEVRTPLNAVSMGITVIQVEMARSLGFQSPSELQENAGEEEEILVSGNGSSKVTDADVLDWFRLSEDILRNTQNAVDVLSDVLNYDKIESGSLSLDLAQIPIWRLVEEAMHEFNLSAKKKNIELELLFVSSPKLVEGGSDDNVAEQGQLNNTTFSSAKGLPQDMRDCKVIGDKVRLTQVIRNVVSNALKFTPEGGAVRVHVIWHRQPVPSSLKRTIHLGKSNTVSLARGGRVEVKVQDTGAGMSEDQLATVFREGIQFNANELQNGKGSGFGLFIAKGIVELHEGSLRADSGGLGKGTVFTMTLPLYHSPDPEDSPTTMPDNSVSVTRSEFTRLNVLVVDDAMSNRKLLGRLLKNAGHRYDLAEDGDVALRMVKESMASQDRYDTVLLDYEMPIMNGPTAAQEIRSAGSDVFIVGITGNALPEDVSYFVSCGANAVLPKPFKMPELEDLWIEHGIVDEVLAGITDDIKHIQVVGKQ